MAISCCVPAVNNFIPRFPGGTNLSPVLHTPEVRNTFSQRTMIPSATKDTTPAWTDFESSVAQPNTRRQVLVPIGMAVEKFRRVIFYDTVHIVWLWHLLRCGATAVVTSFGVRERSKAVQYFYFPEYKLMILRKYMLSILQYFCFNVGVFAVL